MKKLLIALIALSLTAPLFAEGGVSINFSGGASYRYGFQHMMGDKDDAKSMAVIDGARGTTDNVDYLTYQTIKGIVSAVITEAGWDAVKNADWDEAVYLNLMGDDNPGNPANYFSAKGAGITEDQWAAQQRGQNVDDLVDNVKISGLKTENKPFIIADVEMGNLTGKLGVELGKDGVSIKDDNAWLTYALTEDITATYYANSFGRRWVDGKFFGKGKSGDFAFEEKTLSAAAFEIGFMGAYFGLLTNNVYSDIEADRLVPMLHVGFGDEGDFVEGLSFNVGGVLDMPTEDGGDYLAFLGYVKVEYASGTMAADVGSFLVGFGANFGQNHSKIAPVTGGADLESIFAGQSVAAGDDNTMAYLVQVYGGYTAMEGLVIGGKAQFGQQWLKEYDNAFYAMKFEGMVKQYFSANVGLGIGGGYERYAVDTTGDLDPAHGYEIVFETEFRF